MARRPSGPLGGGDRQLSLWTVHRREEQSEGGIATQH